MSQSRQLAAILFTDIAGYTALIYMHVYMHELKLIYIFAV